MAPRLTLRRALAQLVILVKPWVRVLLGRALPRRVRSLAEMHVRNRVGLELGGPSSVFGPAGLLPIYQYAERIDNCNFAEETVWGRVTPGRTFRFNPRSDPGMQFIMDATDLTTVENGSYDFILSSHTLEHIANPLRALREWVRVLRVGGACMLVIPHREGTFDWRRPVTPLTHLLEDERREMGEDDLTHLPEILLLHDRRREDVTSSDADLARRCRDNPRTRIMHHHTFDTHGIAEIIDLVGLQIDALAAVRPYQVVVIATKNDGTTDNRRFLDRSGAPYLGSPFRGDHATLPPPRRDDSGAQ